MDSKEIEYEVQYTLTTVRTGMRRFESMTQGEADQFLKYLHPDLRLFIFETSNSGAYIRGGDGTTIRLVDGITPVFSSTSTSLRSLLETVIYLNLLGFRI